MMNEENFVKDEFMSRKLATVVKCLLSFTLIFLVTLGISVYFSIDVNAGIGDMDSWVSISCVTQDDIDQARADRDDALAQAEAASARVSELSNQQGQLTGELESLNALSDEQMAQYTVIAEQYAAALTAKAEALDRFVKAQDNLEATRQTFSERISVMFEYQNKSTLEVLLESDSLAGFFTNMEIITLIADSDDQAVDMMQIALDDANLQAEYALQEAEEMQAIAEEKQGQLRELEARIGETSAALEDVSTQLSTWEAEEERLNELASELDDQIADLQAQLYAQNHPAPVAQPSYSSGSTVQGNGMLAWPTWTTYVTSYYGNRYHPVYGDYRFHSGIDIGAGFGDTVMAAGSGTVIYVEEPCPGSNYGGSGYGNYVIIDHGNGLSTLYGHMRDVYVSSGEYVSCGQAIGEVGSTGTSTGAHLHFEVRVNGSTTDPLGYL